MCYFYPIGEYRVGGSGVLVEFRLSPSLATPPEHAKDGQPLHKTPLAEKNSIITQQKKSKM